MLINISAENFMSFDKKASLSMIPSKKTTKKPEHKMLVQHLPLLKHAVIYGANAAGKSNLVEIFRFMKYSVMETLPAHCVTWFCRNSTSNSEKDSEFEIQFVTNGVYYAYGFTALLRERKFTSEWLYELNQSGTAKLLFQWEHDKVPQLGEKLNLAADDSNRMKLYIDDFDTDSNGLFLSFMNRNKKYTPGSKLHFFKDAYQWITTSVEIYTPQTKSYSFTPYSKVASLAYINSLVRTFDTGISEVAVEDVTLEELQRTLEPVVFTEFMSQIQGAIEKAGVACISASMRSYTNFYNVELEVGREPQITTLKLKHGSSPFDFKFSEESDGTRRLFDLIDLLLMEAEGKVYVIDELERSLHPKMTARFIELFSKLHENQQIQLIFTTHESSIMDQELFRRDEIWFVERDRENNSHSYSLNKFKERYDKKLSKAYLEGRYGAIPILTDLPDVEVE